MAGTSTRLLRWSDGRYETTSGSGGAGASNLLTNGDFGTPTGWTQWTASGSAPTYDFNYTVDIPTGGVGGALRLSGPEDSNGGLFQAVTLEGGGTYSIEGVMKDIGSADSSAWAEIWLTTTLPVDGVDTADPPDLNAVAATTWDCDDFDTSFADACKIPASGFVPSGSGPQTVYFIIKAGACCGGNYDVVFDEIRLIEQAAPGLARTGYGPRWMDADFDDSSWNAFAGSFDSSIQVEAEDYNTGGEGVGYHDTTSGNTGGEYRSDDVDIVGNPTDGYRVGYISTGEWLKYDITIADEGDYDLSMRYSNGGQSGLIHVEFDGVDATGAVATPPTGGWDFNAMQILGLGTVHLTAGPHVMTFAIDQNDLDVDHILLALPGPIDTTAESLYLRSEFDLEEARWGENLELEIEYASGFAAYLNGVEIARRNLDAPNTFAFHDQPSSWDWGVLTETISLGSHAGLLMAQANVLAIQLHNQPLDEDGEVGHLSFSAEFRSSDNPTPPLISDSGAWNSFVGTNEPSCGLVDMNGDFPDWIELYNPTGAPVDLQGWALTDDAAIQDKWIFPAVTINPGEYLVVFASGKDITAGAEFHTSFELDADGEYLGLFDNAVPRNAVSVLTPAYPQQLPFFSYGLPLEGPFDGTGIPVYFDPPSPGTANASSVSVKGVAGSPVIYAGILPSPLFDVPQGFYDTSVTLNITMPAPSSAVIRYTTDGTEPTPFNGTVVTGSLSLTGTTAIRAAAFQDGWLPSEEVHGTWLIGLSADRKSLPAISLIADNSRVFYNSEGAWAIQGGDYGDGGAWRALGTGDFNHIKQHGRAFERPVSFGWIETDNTGFAMGAGLRVMGSEYSRSRRTSFDKPSFRLYFRGIYGDRELNYPFFPDTLIDEFDKLAIRGGWNDQTNPFIRDELGRRLGLDLGMYEPHGRFSTLFMNGQYAGYMNPVERPDGDAFSEHYHTTNDWDLIKVEAGSGGAGTVWTRVMDGDDVAWTALMDLVATNDMSVYANYDQVSDHLAVEEFIDYLIVQIYGANWDWPNNNWGAYRHRSPEGRFRFFLWDLEAWLDTNPWFGDINTVINYDMFNEGPPYWPGGGTGLNGLDLPVPNLFQGLVASEDFRLLFADRIHRAFFNEGAMTDANISARFVELRSMVEPLISGFDDRALTDIVPNRRSPLFAQFVAEDLWPSVEPPELNPYGGVVASDFQITMTNPNAMGLIYYTLDGSDPREGGTGAISAGALSYTGSVPVGAGAHVKARVWRDSEWSALSDALFTVERQPGDIIISEIFADAVGEDDGLEWFEVYNTTMNDIDLNGWTILDNGTNLHVITSEAPLIVPAKGHFVLGESLNPVVNGGTPVNYAWGTEYTLGNSGDEIILMHDGQVIHSVAYELYTPTPHTPMIVLPDPMTKGAAQGMAINYCDGAVSTWADQTTDFGSQGQFGTPGQSNDGVDLCPTAEVSEWRIY